MEIRYRVINFAIYTTKNALVGLLAIVITILKAYGQCNSQCNISIISKYDCTSNRILLEAKTSGSFVGWSSGNSGNSIIQFPNQKVTWAYLETASLILAKAAFDSKNLIENGDFELGNTAFETGYTYSEVPFTSTGNYSIDQNPKPYLPEAYINKKDHTSGVGKMFIADGSTQEGKEIFGATVQLMEGQEYTFSFWIANIHQEFAKKKPDTTKRKTPKPIILVDGIVIGEFKLPIDTVWYQYSKKWTAKESKASRISISNRETIKEGNDFALDDLSLTYSFTKTDSLWLHPCNQNQELVISPDGDGSMDDFFIKESGTAKIIDIGGNVVKELTTPAVWDATLRNGTVADAGYYAIVVNNTKVYRISVIR